MNRTRAEHGDDPYRAEDAAELVEVDWGLRPAVASIEDATAPRAPGFTALHMILAHPDRVSSAVVAGAGYGAEPHRAETFRAESMLTAAAFAAEGAAKVSQGQPAPANCIPRSADFLGTNGSPA